MAGIRQERLAALLQKEIGSLLQQESSLRFGGHFITVTTVRLTPDLSLARVYLSFMPIASVGKPEEGLALVQAEGFFIRKKLAGKVGKHLRKMPELRFFLDDSLDHYEEIDGLLKGS
ncbi:MAG TPA: 30S ribosome-binding factor RbfA [Flavobacteriales bacterium]|jgi:ribosome-binding factor A|nr:30S ribosome-binding factor RbfA [Flavobacteriales bacterium]